jgi:hypothetical protein
MAYAPILHLVSSLKLAALREAQQRRPLDEGRNEERQLPSLAVVASSVGGASPIAGVTREISRSGLSMLMPHRPSAVHLDVTVSDTDLSVELWVRVVECVANGDGMYVWHAHVVTSDEGWAGIVDRIND